MFSLKESEDNFLKIEYGKKEEKICILNLPIFDIFRNKQIYYQENSPEKEQLTSVENILMYINDAAGFDSLKIIYSRTSYASVKKLILDFYLSSFEELKNMFLKNNPDKRFSKLNKSVSFDSSLTTHKIKDGDFELVGMGCEPSANDKDHGLLETIPTIYQYSDADSMIKINKHLTHVLISYTEYINDTKKFMLNYHYFKMTINCLMELIILAKKNLIDLAISKHLVKCFFIAAISVISQLSSVMNATRSENLSVLPYFSSLFKFAAEGIKFIDADDFLIAQQFWISIVIVYGDLLMAFPTNENDIKRFSVEIPPLNCIAGSYRYEDAAISIDNLIKILQVDRTSSQVAIAINKFFETIPVKMASSLSDNDSLLLLAICSLEKARVKSGDFSTFFDYFKVDYNSVFMNCLELLTDTLLPIFMKSIQKYDADRRAQSVNSLVHRCFENYVGTNLRFATIIDKISEKLFSKYNASLFSQDIVSSFIESLKITEKQNKQRLPKLQSLLKQMINDSFEIAPTLLFSLLINYYLKNVKFNHKIPSIYNVISLMPTQYQDLFLTEMLQHATLYGSAMKLSLEQIVQFEDPDECVINVAYHIDNEKLFPLLIKENASPEGLISAWSTFIMCGDPKLSESFLNFLVTKCSNTIKLNQGLFSTYIDQNMINFHTAVFDLFQKLLAISTHIRIIIKILPVLKGVMIIESPSAISGLLRIAHFLVTVLLTSKLPAPLQDIALQSFIIVLMKIIALNSAPTIFKYIKTNDIFVLKKLICNIPNIIKLPTLTQGSKTTTLMSMNQNTKKKLFDLISFVLSQMLSLFSTYISSAKYLLNDILQIVNANNLKPQQFHLQEIVPIFWMFCPSSLPAIAECLINNNTELISFVSEFFNRFPYPLAFEAHFAKLFAKVRIDDLILCKILPPAQSMVLLTPKVLNHPTASLYFVKCLENFELDEILLYIPQLLQSIRFDTKHVLTRFIKHYARKSYIFQHYFLWNLQYEKCVFNGGDDDDFPNRLVKLEGSIIQHMTLEEHKHYEHEFGFVNSMEKVSDILLPLPVDERRSKLEVLLKDLSIPDDLYVPSNPNYKIVSIDYSNSIPLKSHAKVPILVRFSVIDENSATRKQIPFSCIFKTHDDVRMDAMVIQLIDKFRRIFFDAGIDCFLLPYRVFATGHERGVIECIANSKSRHELGVETKESLLSYFIHKYGQVGTDGFNKAQMNFIKSMAPYSVICYLLQIKDRHNANIMIDSDGHVIHIDFGFIFDISPGGNLKFERAPFKLTQEMIDLMGGSRDSKPFQVFTKLFTRCFIAARAKYDEIESIVSLMTTANFPCFKKDSFVKLRQRFLVDARSSDLSSHIESLITNSMNALTTSAYDMFQKTQNNIFYI